MSPAKTSGSRGFTLLELLVVLVLLSAVVATAVPAFLKTGGIEHFNDISCCAS